MLKDNETPDFSAQAVIFEKRPLFSPLKEDVLGDLRLREDDDGAQNTNRILNQSALRLCEDDDGAQKPNKTLKRPALQKHCNH